MGDEGRQSRESCAVIFLFLEIQTPTESCCSLWAFLFVARPRKGIFAVLMQGMCTIA